jgi:uncharacterized protein YcaQ
MLTLSLHQARKIALWHQLYRFSDHEGKAGTLDAIRTLSYVQIDTINVVERAHHHTLYNRVRNYQRNMLNELLRNDKAVWEYWAHAASYIPIEDYAYYKIRMHNFPNGTWERKFWELHKDLAEPIMDRIRKEGPLSSKDFEDPREKKENLGWGDWKPAKIMLELLMWKGDLIVTARDKFQRVYDLTERVIPDYRKTELPSEQDRAEFMVLRTLQAHGIATAKDIFTHITLTSRQAVSDSLRRLCEKQIICQAKVEENRDVYYSLPGIESAIEKRCDFKFGLYILSPFDNAVILRPRLKKIFEFNYSLECYVTPSKRKFGYWSCPLLWQDKLVGFLDPKAERKTAHLKINSLFINKEIWTQSKFHQALEKELSRFAAFNGCNTYSIDKFNLI